MNHRRIVRVWRPFSSGTVGGVSDDAKGGASMENQRTQYSGDFWKKTSGDCHKITQAVQNKEKLDDAYCQSKGFENCLEMYHSCLSTVVCQVINYAYAKGTFAEQCGTYGPKVARVLWKSWRVLWGAFSDPVCYLDLGEKQGSCGPAQIQVQDQYYLLWDETIKVLQEAFDDARLAAGVPQSMILAKNARAGSRYCIDIDILRATALAARKAGIEPKPIDPQKAQPVKSGAFSSGVVGETGEASDGSMADDLQAITLQLPKDPAAKCARQNALTLHEAIIEFSMWVDWQGFHAGRVGEVYHFYNDKNWTQGVSDACTSAIRLLTDQEIATTGNAGPPNVIEGHVHPTVYQIQHAHEIINTESTRPDPLNPGKSIPDPRPFTAWEMSRQGGKHPFNMWLNQKGYPDRCSGADALGVWDDIGACTAAVTSVLDQRFDALKRTLPWITAMILAQVQREKEAVWSGRQEEQPGMSTGAKVAIGVSVMGAIGYGLWKLWPKLLGIGS